MPKKRLFIKGNLRKGDFERCVVTDTAPYEVPLIVSNDGFYKNLTEGGMAPLSRREVVQALSDNSKPYTRAYRYNIKKDEHSFRKLSLIHPTSQMRVVEFYKKYHSIICYFASRGSFSIRHPAKLGSVFSFTTGVSDQNQFKSDSVDMTQIELFVRNPASFFAYDGYDRLHKYFSSSEFYRSEQNFPKLALLDISKCFSSIYTHTLPWAIKGCDFTKNNLRAATFGDDFDYLMQKMNYNETNGICIGPELSRIFAEIILQAVDLDIERCASEHKLVIGKDYRCRRYVDDYIIFAKDQDTQDKIHGIIDVCLKEYNLHLNEAKYLQYNRPFLTPKSYIIHSAKEVISDFLGEKLTEKKSTLLVPSKIYNRRGFEKSFLDALKLICVGQKVGYDALSDYAISSVVKRITRLTTDYVLVPKKDRREEGLYKRAFEILLNALFFLYSVNPTVSSSYQLGRAIILTIRFVQKYFPDSYPSLAGQTFGLVAQFIRQCANLEKATFQSKIPIEILNVILASRELGDPYLVDETTLREHIFNTESMEYFSIVSCLYYIRNDARYAALKADVEEAIKATLGSCSSVMSKAQDAHLCLDVIACPYVSVGLRTQLYTDFRAAAGIPAVNAPDLVQHVQEIAQQPWFVQWDTVDVLNMLKKKELSTVY